MDREDDDLSLRGGLGRFMFTARWLMAPVYIGLLVALALLVVKFVQRLITLVPTLWRLSAGDTVLAVLGLVDLSLVANLVLIVMLAGWQGFVDPLLRTRLDGQPTWLVMDFSVLKLKVIGAVATIAALVMLEDFMHVESVSVKKIAWEIAILLAMGTLGVLVAVMDRVGSQPGRH
jgi:uncharacterized protein (TIGR00645 family)